MRPLKASSVRSIFPFLTVSLSLALAQFENVTPEDLERDLNPANQVGGSGIFPGGNGNGNLFPGNGNNVNNGLEISHLPDFVGFSYSRASKNPQSPRFIHFLIEVSILFIVFCLARAGILRKVQI